MGAKAPYTKLNKTLEVCKMIKVNMKNSLVGATVNRETQFVSTILGYNKTNKKVAIELQHGEIIQVPTTKLDELDLGELSDLQDQNGFVLMLVRGLIEIGNANPYELVYFEY